ncbi:MAG: exodeoxyribonuclease III [Gammaproteobacteria bacterium]
MRISISYRADFSPAGFFVRVVSFNANGLRSATRKGFFRWFARQRADVLCVQELKAQEEQIADRTFHASGFHRVVHSAQRPGYSGVAIYSRAEPHHVVRAIGAAEFDAEGRYLEARFGNVAVVSAYFPSGSSGPARQEAKFRFLAAFDARLITLEQSGVPFVFCGDFNMAHKNIDLKNWRANQDYPGFTPPERAWLDSLFTARGYVDAFRAVNQDPHHYTWWSNRGRAFENNTGWRIDYQVVSPALKAAVQRAAIYKRLRFSDHAPLTIDYDWEL